MTHEFIDIVKAYKNACLQGTKSVLATVVALNGSSYRKPGVRMLITAKGELTGAVSGGCVEKEIVRQAQSVFKTGIPTMMTYDGRYRLGCEGIIYILIEPFHLSKACLDALQNTIDKRYSFAIKSYYSMQTTPSNALGSVLHLNDIDYPIQTIIPEEQTLIFEHVLPPNFRLLIFGNEHDSIQLCKFTALCGWDIEILTASPQVEHLTSFSDAKMVKYIQPDAIQNMVFDSETAVVLMTHNYAKDLAYLLEMAKHSQIPNYIGILGSKGRMRQLESSLFEHLPDLNDAFIDVLHGPAGLDIGSITPQEIAISILSEITQHVRKNIPVLQN